MASRVINFTMPVDALYHNLYTILAATTGAVPVNGILPDRVMSLNIADPVGGIKVSDSNFANNAGVTLPVNGVFNMQSNRNTVCLRDFWLAGSALVGTVTINFA